MREWIDFIYWAAVYVFALVSLFDAARRLAEHGFQRNPMWLTIVGAVLCIAFSTIQFFFYHVEDDLLTSMKRDSYISLPDDWGKNMQPNERERASVSYVTAAFMGTGKLLDYFTASGGRRLFAPSQDQIRQRESAVRVQTQLEDQKDTLLRNAVSWLLYGFLAGVGGWLTGRNRRLATANRQLNTDVRQETPHAG